MKRLAFFALFLVTSCYTEPKTVAGLHELDVRTCYQFYRNNTHYLSCVDRVQICAKYAGEDVVKYKQCVGY